MLARRDADAARLRHLEVVADREPADRAALDPLDGHAQVVHLGLGHLPSIRGVLASLGRMSVEVTLFTDPACPFAFSAEPVRQRLRWHYGDQLEWSTRMIVLTDEPGEAEKLAAGAPNLQRRYGMPIDPAPYPRASSSEPACLAVVAARLDDPAAADRLLRRLRVRRMAGGPARRPGADRRRRRGRRPRPGAARRRSQNEQAASALAADRQAARAPSAAARALKHRLGGAHHVLRYVAPSYELRATVARCSIPGLQPVRGLRDGAREPRPVARAPRQPRTWTRCSTWATEPLATAEIVALLGDDEPRVRSALAGRARPTAAGADFYWSPELARRVVDLEEVPHLGHPAFLHEPHVIRMAVVVLVGGAIRELHRDPEAVVVLRADLGEQLERLDAGDRREPPGRVEEVPLLVRACGVDERERDGVPDAIRVHQR